MTKNEIQRICFRTGETRRFLERSNQDFPRIQCKDGWSLEFCYLQGFPPRSGISVGSNSSFKEELLLPWKATPNPYEIGYTYVPIIVLDTVIAVHDASGAFQQEDEKALVIADALRSEGVLTSEEPNPSFWSPKERIWLAYGVALIS